MLFLIAFIWGFAESTIFFIIPDVILTYIAFFYWIKKWIKASFWAVFGALLGWSLIYFLAWSFSYHFFEYIPLINEKMTLLTKDLIRENIINIIYGPLNWIPYKLYAYWSWIEHISYFKFLILSFLARIWRFLLVVFIAGTIGYFAKNSKNKYKRLWQIIFIIVWILIYIVYYLKIKEIYY